MFSRHPAGLQKPVYLGNQGTWTERGPLPHGAPESWPRFNGFGALTFTNMAGIQAIRGLLYNFSAVQNNGGPVVPQDTTNPTTVGPFGQPIMAQQQTPGAIYFGNAG